MNNSTDDKIALFIWSNNYPFEIRLKKELETLLNQGYNVHIICNNYNNQPVNEQTDNINIHRIPYKKQKVINTAFFLNPIWYFHINKLIKEISPDIIISRDLPLSIPSIILSKLNNKPLIVDIAEHFPALMKENKKWSKNKFLSFLWYNLYIFIEKFTLKNAKYIIVVCEEQKRRIIEQYKIKENALSIVNNTPKIEKNCQFNYKANIDSPLSIVYTGQIDAKFRGIETLLEAAKYIKDSDIIIKILGGGIDEEKHRNFVKENNLRNVIISGYMPHKQLINEIKSSDLGIIPHTNSDVIQYTMPNKIFDYMLQSKPVIVSNARPLERIIKESDCGYIFEACNAQNLADLILHINANRNELYKKALNGFNAIKDKYNWEKDSIIFENIINKVIYDRKRSLYIT